jgi:hypothetical protein
MPQEEECKAIIIEASNRGNSCKFTGGHYVGYKGREQGDPGTWVTLLDQPPGTAREAIHHVSLLILFKER